MVNLVLEWMVPSHTAKFTSISTPGYDADDAQDTYQQTGQLEANIRPA